MLGSLGGARWDNIGIPFWGCLAGALFFLCHARSFDLIALGTRRRLFRERIHGASNSLSMIVVRCYLRLFRGKLRDHRARGLHDPHVVRFIIGT